MNMEFCRRCGAPFEPTTTHVFHCPNGHEIYSNPAPSVGVILENKRGEIVVLERAFDPGKGSFDLPGGFCDGSEALEDAIRRELTEEIGLTADQYSTPVFIASGIDDYNFNGEIVPALSCVFYAQLLQNDTALTAGDDAASAQFIPADAQLADKLYFKSLQTSLKTFLRNANTIRQLSTSTV